MSLNGMLMLLFGACLRLDRLTLAGTPNIAHNQIVVIVFLITELRYVTVPTTLLHK